MKKRIGNDITFTWHIYRKDGDTQVPESFDGKDVEVKLISPLKQPVTIEDVTIATGVVTFTFRGKHQVTLGNYVAVLQENRGEDGMVTLDVVSAVSLVAHSYMEEDGDEGDVIEAEAVELESTISAGGGGGFVQQQADWAQTDASAVDFIKNKPDLGLYVPRNDDDGHGNMTIYGQGGIYMALADEQGAIYQTASFGAGGWFVSSPRGTFQTSGNTIYRGTLGIDQDSVVWEKTATQQIPAATTEENGLMSAEDKGKLNDLPTATELAQELGGKADSADLAEVATSGSYNDLADKPTIPAAQVQSDWNESDTASKAYIKNKPTIPTVPTNVSAFNNDAGYITEDDMDDVPTPNSNNLVKSGGVYSTTPSITNTTDESDLDVSDEEGNVLMRLSNGHIKTKNFNSELYARIISGVDYDSEVVPVTNANAILSYKQHKSIGSFDFDFKWVGACLAANGRIYGITNGNRQVLEINPETDTYCLFGNLSSGSFKWSGCGIGKNGMIYGYPRSANSVLIIDPVTQGVEEVDLGTNYEPNHHYGGCIVGDYMYLAPRTANHILKINLRTWQIERLGEDILTDITRYSACIYHPNGYIYFIPEYNAKVLKLNPLNDAIIELGSVLSSCSVYGASVAPSNKCIYGFTNRTNGGILKIDVENNDTISFIHEGTVGNGYYSTELALNGKLYSGVGNGTDVWELDPTNDTVTIVDTISDTVGGDYNEAKCAGGVLAENGSIYLIPAKGRHIYKLEFDGQVVRTMPRKVLMSNYFSNY